MLYFSVQKIMWPVGEAISRSFDFKPVINALSYADLLVITFCRGLATPWLTAQQRLKCMPRLRRKVTLCVS